MLCHSMEGKPAILDWDQSYFTFLIASVKHAGNPALLTFSMFSQVMAGFNPETLCCSKPTLGLSLLETRGKACAMLKASYVVGQSPTTVHSPPFHGPFYRCCSFTLLS